jgi:Leucine-rich repeat (LRR) protein
MVSFALLKAFETTRYTFESDFLFSTIASADISVKNTFTNRTTTFKALPANYYETFVEETIDEELYDRNGQSAYIICGATSWLEAGSYIITDYVVYSDTKGRNKIGSGSIADTEQKFNVEDNLHTLAIVPIVLSKEAEHIKDYKALKEIWLALDGPNWTFHGEEYIAGANWDFNKDIDMWGDQPGVTLDGNGRVVGLNISGFGAKGVVPDAIGQLTELRSLYLGNHNELIGGYDAGTTARIHALDYMNNVVSHDVREDLSPELKLAINSDPTFKAIPMNSPQRKDVAYGNLTNGITAISRAMMRLTKLEQLFIANSPITDEFFAEVEPSSEFYAERETWSWSNFDMLTDVEIYNCAQLTRLPMEMLSALPNVQSLNISMNRGISGEQLKADWEAFIDGASVDDVQILYMGYNNLRETPSHEYLKRMTKLGYLDCTNNRLEIVHPFGKEVSFATIYLDNNAITRIYSAEDGYFCGLSQMETFSCSNNRLTELPDIFTAQSVYTMQSANFSSNNISALENGEKWRGINASSLNLADNRFEEIPSRLMKSGSKIETLMLSSNGIRKIAEGALTGPYSYYLTTIDLSFNRLTELPYDDFSALNMPYLYGIDLSSNAFSAFPYAPLGINTLTVMSIRQQRDDEGNRTLREWPTGLYTCPKMSAFYIGSNDLRKIEDTISPYILLFEIKDNPNISIDLSGVCAYIEMGYYELIYDSTQDIRGCDALNLD